MTTIEGWSNAPTHRVNLWLANDEALHNEAIGVVRDVISRVRMVDAVEDWAYEVDIELCPVQDVADALKAWVREMLFPKHPRVPERRTTTSFSWIVRDLLEWAFSQVDWRELAEEWITKCDELRKVKS